MLRKDAELALPASNGEYAGIGMIWKNSINRR